MLTFHSVADPTSVPELLRSQPWTWAAALRRHLRWCALNMPYVSPSCMF